MALYLDIGVNDELRVGEDTVLTLEQKSGGRARLKITGEGRVVLVKNGKAAATNAPPQPFIERVRQNTGD